MDRLRNICMAAAAMLACCTAALAQGGYGVSGTVEDQLGPVIGATVMEQGTVNGTSTGIDGSFSLTVTGPSALVEIS